MRWVEGRTREFTVNCGNISFQQSLDLVELHEASDLDCEEGCSMFWSSFSFGQALIVRRPLNFVSHGTSP
jgi:hypothetical protein